MTTAAGSRLPDDFSSAICTPLDQLAGAAFAAAPFEDAWTPELREALAAFAGAGVTGPDDTAGEAVT